MHNSIVQRDARGTVLACRHFVVYADKSLGTHNKVTRILSKGHRGVSPLGPHAKRLKDRPQVIWCVAEWVHGLGLFLTGYPAHDAVVGDVGGTRI